MGLKCPTTPKRKVSGEIPPPATGVSCGGFVTLEAIHVDAIGDHLNAYPPDSPRKIAGGSALRVGDVQLWNAGELVVQLEHQFAKPPISAASVGNPAVPRPGGQENGFTDRRRADWIH